MGGSTSDLVAVATNSENLKIYDTSSWNCDVIYGHNDIIMCIDSMDDTIVTGSKVNELLIYIYLFIRLIYRTIL